MDSNIETAIAQFIIRETKPKKIMCNTGSQVEYLVAKGVRYGYMLALSQMNMFAKKNKKW